MFFFIALIGISLTWPGAGQGEAKESRGKPPSEIEGTVRINGCVVDPSQIAIQAIPMGVTSSDGRQFTPDPRAVARLAKIKRTNDPHLFKFSIMGLHPATLYRLGISYPPNPCDKVFWRGPMDGLAVSGGPPVEIEGFVARTEVELFQIETDEWVGMDDLQFADPVASIRTLRWRSTITGVTGGELQISTEAFPTSGRFGSCDEPPGAIIHREMLSAPGRQGEWGEVDVDFHEILSPRRVFASRSDDALTEDDTISDAVYERLIGGAPLFVRIVPLINTGRACNLKTEGVHGWVILAKLPLKFEDPSPPPPPPMVLEASGDQWYNPPFLKGAQLKKPTYNDVSYKVVKKHTLPPDLKKMGWKESLFWRATDPLGSTLIDIGYYNPGITLNPGAWFTFTPPSSGGSNGGVFTFFTNFAGWLVTAGVGAFGDALTYAANLYQEVKKTVAEVVVTVITTVPGIGEACEALKTFNTSCADVVQVGMEYGLTSMGIPPSLPNWEELKDQGIDYLASEIASEIEKKTGVPSELTEDQLKDLAKTTINEMTKKRGNSNGPQYDWVIPYFGYDPAVWTLRIKKNGSDPLPANIYIRTKASSLYRSAQVHLPSRFPSSGILKIPVVLQPAYEAIPVPYCKKTLAQGIACTPSFFLKTPVCEAEYYDYQGMHTFSTNCEGLNWTSIYYRDQWASRVKASGCITISAISSMAGKLWFLHPIPPFVEAATVDPDSLALWDGPFHVDYGCK